MSARLEGKVAVVIGAAGRDNMAQAIARRLLADGASLVVAGRHEDELARFAGETGCSYSVADLTDEGDLDRLMRRAEESYGGLDIAVNATGWGLLVPFLDMTRADLEKMVQLQFVGSILFYQAALRHMRDGGSLVQISSATASIMLEDHAAYMGTKAGTEGRPRER